MNTRLFYALHHERVKVLLTHHPQYFQGKKEYFQNQSMLFVLLTVGTVGTNRFGRKEFRVEFNIFDPGKKEEFSFELLSPVL